MNLINKIISYFSSFKHKPKTLVKEDKETNKVSYVSKLEEVKIKFNPKTDIIVIGDTIYEELSAEDKRWLETNSSNLFIFKGGKLMNIAIVRGN